MSCLVVKKNKRQGKVTGEYDSRRPFKWLLLQDREILVRGQMIVLWPQEQRLYTLYLDLQHSQERGKELVLHVYLCIAYGKSETLEQLSG